jgi:V8-like Glu-specific endopeptidase
MRTQTHSRLRSFGRSGSSIFALVFSLLAPGEGSAQQPPSPPTAGETTSIERRTTEPSLERYRSREERLRAQPLDWNQTIGRPAEVPPEAATADPAREQPGTAQGGPPDPDADEKARREFPSEWRTEPQPGRGGGLNFPGITLPEAEIQLAGTRDTFTQFCENCPPVRTNKTPPWRAAGKLFLNGGYCSASVISPNNIIVTAAHCCWNRSTNNWIGGWTFAPAYDNGNTPYGLFPWTVATILTAWRTSGGTHNDVCLINLGTNSVGGTVTSYVGWLGRSWNFGSVQVHDALGYPDNLGGGQTLQLCHSESFSPSAGCGGTAVLNAGCSMTFGSSGGAWIRAYRTSSWVNSVVSGYHNTTCTGTFGSTFNGPRFTSSNILTLCNAAGC